MVYIKYMDYFQIKFGATTEVLQVIVITSLWMEAGD
jgi:hypothetical protein